MPAAPGCGSGNSGGDCDGQWDGSGGPRFSGWFWGGSRTVLVVVLVV